MRAAASLALIVVSSAPARGEPRSGAVAEVIAAERAFAKRCGEVGFRASFLEFFAPDGVSFEPGPGNARARLLATPATKEPFSLEWGPEQAEAAPAGDLGWSTGPSLVTDRTGKRPPAPGYYFSVWRRQPDGTLKVEIDVGVGTPTERPIPAVAGVIASTAAPGDERGREVIEREDRAFCARAAAGAGAAFAAALARNARVHRPGALPLVGEAAWRPWAAGEKGVMSCTPAAALSSTGPGFGYTYGKWERRDVAGGAVAVKGFYTRVWRREKDGWRIAVDVATVVR
jgi:ketosteroid isomerase-like protein